MLIVETFIMRWMAWDTLIAPKYINFFRGNMSDLAWAVKNGDMDQVKELVEGKVESYKSCP